MSFTVLWDNDGVLVDTEGLYYRPTREVLARSVSFWPPSSLGRFHFDEGRALSPYVPDEVLRRVAHRHESQERKLP